MAEVTPLKRKSEVVEIPGFGPAARVQLKSGGPEMQVREQVLGGSKAIIRCDWITPEGQPVTADYYLEQLYRIERFEVD